MADIVRVISLVITDKIVRNTTILVTILVILFALLISLLGALVIYLYYFGGLIICWYFVKYNERASTCIKGLAFFYQGFGKDKKKLKHSCSICDTIACQRHHFNKIVDPWEDIFISKELNDSFEHLCNRIIENFISSWYGQITNDETFVNELRCSIRYCAAVLIKRFYELDTVGILTEKLVPFAVQHVDDYMYMQQYSKLKNIRINEVIIQYFGKRLHVAATNRNDELSYLKNLVEHLLPCILNESSLKSRNYLILIRELLSGWVLQPLMDVVADPNIINLLIIFITNHRMQQEKLKIQNDEVQFLENFSVKKRKKTLLYANLVTITNNTELLYALMQFLKKHQKVHLLQFCLDVVAFQAKLITPELSKNQLLELFTEAQTLYKEYLNKESLNFISCPDSISEEFNIVIKSGFYNIANLKTNQAYEFVINILENIWLPQFFESSEFFAHICGPKITSSYAISKAKKKHYDFNPSTVSKLSSGIGKIKGVLKSNQPIDGSIYRFEIDGGEGSVHGSFPVKCDNLFRDLSTWKVTIPSYQADKIVQFCIKVQLPFSSEDIKNEWHVNRRDQDFFTLKAKLVEFHGEHVICDSPLPSRKAGSSVDSRLKKYEEFLKKLLLNPTLSGSDLLYNFLTTEDFTLCIQTNGPALPDIGNMYQSVAYKLRKEKGQYLDNFMSNFLTSTGYNKSNAEVIEVGEEQGDSTPKKTKKSIIPKTYRNYIFNDNFGVKHSNLTESKSSTNKPLGGVESLLYLFKHIFKLHPVILNLYVSLARIAQEFVEFLLQFFIKRKIKNGLSESHLVHLIKVLEEVIFQPHIPPTKDDLEERKKTAFSRIQQIKLSYVHRFVGNQFNSGCAILLEILQHPHYNKQLVYNLLDIIIMEMFPTLFSNPTKQQ